MGVTADLDWHGHAHGPVVPADLDDRQIKRVEDQLDLASDQSGVDLVGVGVHAHRCRLGHHSGFGPQERLS